MITAIIPVAHSVYEWIQGAVDKSQKRTVCILESSCVIPAHANAWRVWLGAKQMIGKRLAMPTIRVIFPRILALLSAEATVERLVLCTMWINKTSIMKLGGIILKKTWMIPTNGRCFFQTTTYCRVQLVKKKRIALRKRWSNREQVTTAQQRICKWKLLVESIALFELSDHCIPSFSHQTQADIRWEY